jgi:hopanoid biosynthesis associated radical SAM protein HpnH
MSRPRMLDLRVASYLLHQKLSRVRRFPFVTMLEPLERCNLSCVGCGRVREYQDVMDRTLSLEECMQAVRSSGAPIVSISGGEPLLHPQIDQIVRSIADDGRYMYLCTNGLLLESMLDRFPPSPQLCFVVHLDGTRGVHDAVTDRAGTFDAAMSAIRSAMARGHRVSTNTTLFHGTDVEDVQRLFRMLTDLGVEGLMVSPGYAYEDAPHQELFLQRQESIDVFRRVLDPSQRHAFYNNPLYLDFLRGEREYDCAAWTTVTYTVMGWRLPCYAIADRHTDDLQELYEDDLWKQYGPGRDKRCTNCMMHSSFEGASVLDAFHHPRALLRLARGARGGRR